MPDDPPWVLARKQQEAALPPWELAKRAQSRAPQQPAAAAQGPSNGMLGTFLKGAAVGADRAITGAEELLGKGLKDLDPGKTKTLSSLITGKEKPGFLGRVGDSLLADVAAERQLNQTGMAADKAAHPRIAAAGDFIGNTALIGGAAGLMAKGAVAASALGGALAGATDPVDSAKNFWTEKAKQIGIGTVAGLALGKLGEKIAPTVKAVSGDAKDLLDAGVKLLPGQMAGGAAKSLEEKATSLPITGHFVQKGLEESRDSFNIAVLNQALSHIGAKLPDKITAGRDAIRATYAAVGKAYDTILPRMTLKLDKPLGTSLSKLISDAKPSSGGLKDDIYNHYKNYLTGRVLPVLSKGNINGLEFKELQSDIGTKAAAYSSSPYPFVRELGESLKDVKLAMDAALERQNPNFGPHLRSVNAAYAMLARVSNAAGRRSTSEGKFTPGDLLAAIRTQDKSVRKQAFDKGDSLMQPFAEKAQRVIGNRTPDSGTAGRMLAAAALHGGGANTLAILAPKTLGPLAAGAAAYTKPGTAAARYLAQAAPKTRNAIANAIPGAVPFGAPGAAGLTNSEN